MNFRTEDDVVHRKYFRLIKDLAGGGGGLSDKCTYMYAHLYILL